METLFSFFPSLKGEEKTAIISENDFHPLESGQRNNFLCSFLTISVVLPKSYSWMETVFSFSPSLKGEEKTGVVSENEFHPLESGQ